MSCRGVACILGSATSPPPYQESGVPVLSNFGVLLYLWLHPLTQNNQKCETVRMMMFIFDVHCIYGFLMTSLTVHQSKQFLAGAVEGNA